VSVRGKVRAYCDGVTGERDRERSWLYCYQYFQELRPKALAVNLDHAALQLGFYLASWGMFRGSNFLPRYAYTIYCGVIELLVKPKFSVLWEKEFGSGDDDSSLCQSFLRQLRPSETLIHPLPGTGVASDSLLT
jgi:hypothetical protein